MATRNALYTPLTLAVLALVVGPIGIAVFVLGFGHGDSPCVLCWAQRTGMVLIALTGLFVIRFGPRPRYIGLAVLLAAFGIYMGLRHSSLHLWRDVGQGFSAEIFGAHTYTWSMFIYWVSVVMMGALLLMLKDGEATGEARRLRPLERATLWLFLLAAAGNAVQAFASTGPPPYMGQGDPVRFSFNPAHWVWSLEEWRPAPISLRGRWAIEKPDVGLASADPAGSPLAAVPVLPALRHATIALPLDGPITDLAYNEATDRFLVTTEKGIYITDGAFSRVLRHTVVDTMFSVDLARLAAGTFLAPDTVLAVSENKSYVILRESDRADAAANFRYFLASFDTFEELSRSRFSTVRAKMMYVMSVAFDPATGSVYTVTVPNAKVKRLVVSRFDRRDMTLSEEFTPALGPDSGLAFKTEKGSIDSFYPSGAAFAGGRLYVISAAFGTLLAIDPQTRTVVLARTIPGLERPIGLAIKGSEAYIVNAAGAITVVPLPS
ncbi:MAG: disulfide bond formation protein B [Vicinamibacterales bacterium]|jgi:disulfide bond formation protein DsbB|nr:disulfide bond formation protein B [Vicinamibacterales bacterium]